MSTHTPSEWRIRETDDASTRELYDASGAFASCIAERAPLLAAAPDLLAALIALKQDYEELARNHADAWHNDEVLAHQKLNEQARAAIAKATNSQ